MNLEKELASLERMNASALRERYAELFGETTRTGNRAWLFKRIAWRIQSLAEGGLSEHAKRRAAELANEADLRPSPPRAIPADATSGVVATGTIGKHDNRLPPPGSVLTREYKGRQLRVRVLPNGFEFEGDVFKSLSGLAKSITGQHLNGYQFFRLGNGKQREPSKK